MSLVVNHYLAMFCGNWSSTGGDMKYSNCHPASHNHVIDFLGGSSSLYVTALLILEAIYIVVI